MADDTEANELAALVAAGSEGLEVEYKAWMDTSLGEVRAKLAKHLGALSNHGGGYLVFGVDDVTRKPESPCPFDLRSFGEDALTDIVRAYDESDICVLSRRNDDVEEVESALNQRGYQTVRIRPDKADDRRKSGLRLSTMHLSKGLELGAIGIVRVKTTSCRPAGS